jgi:hypothetical protein
VNVVTWFNPRSAAVFLTETVGGKNTPVAFKLKGIDGPRETKQAVGLF